MAADSTRRARSRFSWSFALLLWIAISVAGWAMIGGIVALFSPEQASQVADEHDERDLDTFAPAAGSETRE